jgi:AraC-like DNA-binding protein
LNYIEYGARTRIAPGELGGFYLLQIPLTGSATITNGMDRYQSNPMAAAILNPHLPTTMVWEEGTRQVLVQVSRSALLDHLSAHLGSKALRPITFRGAVDLTAPAGAALRRLVLHLVKEIDAGLSPIGQGLMGKQLEAAIMSGLLEAGQHDFLPQLAMPSPEARPRNLRLAETYIIAHLDQPVTLEEIAQFAGIGPRALQIAFRKHHLMSPLQYWRMRRLAQAHAELSSGAGNVTDTALRWGFSHFGRFAESYRAQYGQTPNQTLRSAKSS